MQKCFLEPVAPRKTGGPSWPAFEDIIGDINLMREGLAIRQIIGFH